MDDENLVEKLSELVEDLAFDYERFSPAGKEIYDAICSIVNKLQGG